jgi:hypothetical protein
MLSFDIADAAIRLRLLAVDRGSFDSRSPRGFVRTTKAVLPGSGTIVVVATDGSSTSTGKMFYADGRPMSVHLDLDQPDMLASLIHNVDCEAFGEGLPDGFGIEDLAAIDAAVLSASWPVVGRIKELLATTQFSGRVGGEGGLPTDDHLVLLGRMAASGDPRVAGAAMSALGAHARPRLPFDMRASLIRCSAAVESLYANNGDAVEATVPTDDGTWHRVFTRAGITAVARRMDRLEGEFYKWPELLSERRPVVERLQQLLAQDMRRPDDGGVLHYFLEREGVAEVVALVRGGDFHAERGDREELTAGDLDSLAALKACIAPDAGYPGLSLR